MIKGKSNDAPIVSSATYYELLRKAMRHVVENSFMSLRIVHLPADCLLLVLRLLLDAENADRERRN